MYGELRTAAGLALLLPSIIGCGEDILLIDPPVVFETTDDTSDGGGEPSVILGIFSEQFFVVLDEGDSLPIIAGFQGGDWVMPAIRAQVLRGAVTANAQVTTMSTEEIVGTLENAQDRLQPTAEGDSEIVGLPIPIRHVGNRATDPIDDLYGERARIELTLKDNQGRSAAVSTEVILVQD